jgi:hypothetical protein
VIYKSNKAVISPTISITKHYFLFIEIERIENINVVNEIDLHIQK